MTESRKRTLLFLALAGVVGWSGWLAINGPATDDTEIELAKPVARMRGLPAPAPATATAATSAKIQEAAPRLALTRTNLFPEQTWYVPPPPPPPPRYVPPPPPPPPQAPPLPFSYMGRWQEAGQTTYYLTRGSLPVSVRPNQVLDGVWRLEPVTGGMLNFTYIPLNQTRSLRTGE
jgi:hypothetical protein